ncbi:hypothetical protein G7Y89_g14073 [Cudoniella acicularis]|uniref:Telomere length regulation protein conserved domain-containing protein n=1 Tax=Cudoniella acicularis TaxID=354080 RepID=A0A8H4R8I7_9HELO|nr:hypothetical protein G7Y89_g14073 [Cudoniella acicularis]
MEGLLTPVSTIYKPQATTPNEALEILKNEPNYDALISTLRYLRQGNSGFNISSPSPLASQLIHALVSEILPNYWEVLNSSESKVSKKSKKLRSRHSQDLELLLSCLRNVTGLNAIILSLKQHIQLAKETKKVVGGPNAQEILAILFKALTALLEGDETAQEIFHLVWDSSDPAAKKKAIWNEFLGLVGGKILGIAAEAEDIINDLSQSVREESYWVSDSSLFTLWTARNICRWSKDISLNAENDWRCCSELLSKTLRLGHSEKVIHQLLGFILLQSEDEGSHFIKLLDSLSNFEQRNMIFIIFQVISKYYISADITTEADSSWWKSDAKPISGAVKLVKVLIAGEESRKTQVLAWLTSSSGAGVGEGIAIRRAVIAALAEDKSDIETVLEKSIQQIGDKLYINHTPTMQQEAHTQVLLLAAGYVHRKAPLRLAMMMRSGSHLNAVSNRLAASSPRARFLGMAIGEALSSLVDKGDKRMDFKVDEMSSADGKWYKSLVNVADTVGSLDSLKLETMPAQQRKFKPQLTKPAKKATPMSGTSKIISIEEVETDEEKEESDDEDLVPYRKPDSDAEDSDEDATNIVRNKPTAPVYIRDLITYLRNTEDYDRQKLGLATAAPLIRRKTNFGTEVSIHAEELATLLVGLQDKYDMDDFQDMRLQGMIAILIALPSKMGPWFSKTFFDGDYSLSQRASILTTLGLGARELAGYGSVDKKPHPQQTPRSSNLPLQNPPSTHAQNLLLRKTTP